MDNFYKSFRDNLNNRKEPDFVENDWLALQSKLPTKRAKNFSIPAFGWLVPFVLLSLIGNIYFFSEMKKTNHLLEKISLQRDTVYQTTVVYQTDTIYLNDATKPIRFLKPDRFETSNSGQNIDEINNENGNGIALNEDVTKPVRFLKPDRFETSNSGQNVDETNNENNTEIASNDGMTTPFPFDSLNTNLLNVPIFTIPTNKYLNFNAPIQLIEKQNSMLSEKFVSIGNTMRPKAFEIGILGELNYAFNLNIQEQIGYGFGLEGKAIFSDAIKFWGAAAYSNFYFEAHEIDASLGIPNVQPPSIDFELAKVDVYLPSIQYSLGLEYYFNTNYKLRPLIGVGYKQIFSLPSDFHYTFFNDVGAEWEAEETVRNENFQGKYGLFRLGLEYEMSKHWQIQMRGIYQHNFHKKNYLTPASAGFQTGIFYKF